MPELKDMTIRQAKPRAVRYEIKDSERAGLRVVVQPSGHKSFVYRYTGPDGKYKKLTLGTYGTMTLAQAIDARRKAADALVEGKDPCTLKRTRANPDGTVTAAVARYKAQHVSTLRHATRGYVERELAAILDVWGARQLRSITRADVVRFLDDADPRGPNAVNCRLKVTAAFLRWCANRADIEASPAVGISRRKVRSRDRVLSNKEIATVWHAADGAGGPPGALVKLLLLTACRRNEIAALEPSEVQADAIVLPPKRVKTDVGHTIPLTTAMRRVLAKCPTGGKYVLTGTDFPVSTGSRAKEAIDAHAPGLAPWTIHDLRRSVATGLAELKVAPHIIELCLNHMPKGVAAIYNRARYADEVKAAFETWSCHIELLVTEKESAAAA